MVACVYFYDMDETYGTKWPMVHAEGTGPENNTLIYPLSRKIKVEGERIDLLGWYRLVQGAYDTPQLIWHDTILDRYSDDGVTYRIRLRDDWELIADPDVFETSRIKWYEKEPA